MQSTYSLFIASDHAGFELKKQLIEESSKALQMNLQWTDLGTHNATSVDYPDYGYALAKEIKSKGLDQGERNLQPLGVLICGSGIGISISANRYPYIRAALCESEQTARLAREHNQANVLCMGARILTKEQALQILKTFLTAVPEQNERHLKRIQKLGNPL